MDEIKTNVQDANLCSWINQKFLESMVSKSPETKIWKKCYEAYFGTLYLKNSKPSYKSDVVINYVFKTIETLRPIMVDNNPKFMAMARTKDGIDRASAIEKAMDYEWDREGINRKLYASLIPTLVTGNIIFYIPWDGNDGKLGNIKCIPVDPYNFYIDPLANTIQEAQYCMYSNYFNVNQLKKLYPNKANDLVGSAIKYSELVAEKDKNAVGIKNQVLVIETWMRDYTTEEIEEEINGQKFITKKRKYPKGRWVVCAPELNIILSDKENPYRDGKFPFVQLKDYDIPFKFWGKGDVEQLLSPQHYMNELNNQIIDNAKHTANMQWIVDKNAGIPQGSLTNRPGLIVRKNPGTEVKRDVPPPMPSYVNEKILEMKGDMETISGIHEANAGDRPTGLQSGTAIMALQDAGQTRVRLKVKLMEVALTELANMWYSRMQQFWKTDRFVRVTKEEGITEFDKITKDDLLLDYDIKILAGSTMPNNKSAKLDLMIRLAQTNGEDGFPMVDRRAVLEFVDLTDKKGLLDRMDKLAGQGTLAMQMQKFEQQYQMDKQQTTQILQQLTSEVKGIAQDIKTVQGEFKQILDENNKLKIARDAMTKGYQQGLKEIPPDLRPEEQKAMEAMRMQNEDDQMMKDLQAGKIPDNIIQELDSMPPEELKKLIDQYPQLENLINNQ